MEMTKRYLGDGVYADWDADEVGTMILTTENGVETTNRIVLSEDEITALMLFVETAP
jgi:hypothetical protein